MPLLFAICTGIVIVCLAILIVKYKRRQLLPPSTNTQPPDGNGNAETTALPTQAQHRKTNVGDRCPICLETIEAETMHQLLCDHGMHEDCFYEFVFTRMTCLTCNVKVIFTKSSDQCSLCLDNMETYGMEYQRCGHAFHIGCMRIYKQGSQICPQCRAPF